MKRIVLDTILILAIAALGFLFPATLHGRAVAGSLWIFAGVYAAVALAAPVLSDRTRSVIDLASASMFFLRAWLESFPANSHSTEIGAFIAIGMALMALALSPPRRAVAAAL